ncbi:hypothetical protein [Psychrobacter cryohalolentis]|uniref:Uncharacterized protein n=1 Tax=Psychrobacter cryohalolentis (strain ATCC BAA-1226 / DSM 17306 / VKM B-2378 / K5) TaxID=335284 RepID=Q1QAW4_PSYCK|nr:hypothetical protein [Psychrobacter cryohalolentis]ABE75189.1 conserved hypothetical protein [Psychrobacter cryohalolentis K5]ASE25386.1 hypothetical protein CEP87_01895 [Psychrobacter cryohalolentis]
MHMITNSSLLLPFNKIAMTIVAILMAFWLSACSVTPSSTSVVQPDQSDSSVTTNKNDLFSYQACVYPPNETVQACTAKGGAFSQRGRLGCYQCVVTYTDAGKACQDSTDCQGKCKNTGKFIKSGTKNQSGQCASDSSGFGCYQTIEKGVAQPAICVD